MDKDTLYEIGAELINNIFDCMYAMDAMDAMENKYGKHDLLLIQILATKIVKRILLKALD